jgi:hypothetical protein
MLGLQLGLTKTYNLFHCNAITAQSINYKDKQIISLQKHLEKLPGTIPFDEAIQGILKLRALHVEMDQAVLDAYGWNDIELLHDFYEVDYLPENDRIRFTIHPAARKEVLRRLLELNHKIHDEEVKAGLWDKKPAKGGGVRKGGSAPPLFFHPETHGEAVGPAPTIAPSNTQGYYAPSPKLFKVTGIFLPQPGIQTMYKIEGSYLVSSNKRKRLTNDQLQTLYNFIKQRYYNGLFYNNSIMSINIMDGTSYEFEVDWGEVKFSCSVVRLNGHGLGALLEKLRNLLE